MRGNSYNLLANLPEAIYLTSKFGLIYNISRASSGIVLTSRFCILSNWLESVE